LVPCPGGTGEAVAEGFFEEAVAFDADVHLFAVVVVVVVVVGVNGERSGMIRAVLGQLAERIRYVTVSRTVRCSMLLLLSRSRRKV
jgi:hypothetical protein